MTEPAPTEVVWPSSAVIDDGSLVLVDGARSRVSLCRCAGGVAVVKRFRGATANRHRDAASRRFAAERRAAWALADASPFVLRPLATVVDAPVMAVVLPFCGRFRSLDVLLHGGATHDWSPAGDRGGTTVVPFTDVTRTDAQLQTVVEVKYSTTALPRRRQRGPAARAAASFGGLEFCDLVRESWADAPAARPRAAAFAERLAACFAGDAIFERGVSVKGRGAHAADADEPLWTCDAAAAEPPAVEEALGPLTDAERDAVDAMGRRRRRRPPRRGWAWEAHQGPWDAMEDAAGGLDYGPHAGCYVVSDGHGGAAVARLAVDSLPTLVARSAATTARGDAGDDAVARVLRDTAPEPHFGPKALVGAALDGRAADNVAALVVYLHRHPEDGDARGCALA
ncbi:hypothetical protein JL721_12776 [Aureococcus anophagefferens]|nr:hypothetical protein JL721_12776 [Aureococcus anophagefferens]